MADRTYDLMEEIRRLMNECGESPEGKLAMAVLLLDERLRAVEKWQACEDERTREG